MTRWIDLTRPLHAAMPIYAQDGYSDPPFGAERWSSIAAEGFEVWRLALATQMGTHVDAPSHFLAGAPGIEALAPDDCSGRYFYLSASALAAGRIPEGYGGERLLFLAAHPEVATSEDMLRQMLALAAPVWIMAGALRVESADPFRLHRALAAAGKFLVEDLDPAELARVTPRGEAIALPLRLTGVSGSPARVLVRNLG